MDTSGAALPSGIVREASDPERLVIVWARRDVTRLIDALGNKGHLVLCLNVDETEDLVEIAGAPSLIVVEADLLDESTVQALDRLRGALTRTRIAILADADSHAAGLLIAMRHGFSEVLDPDDPAALDLVLPSLHRRHGERVLAIGAHPDDVEIGCGATLLRHGRKGNPLTVLTLSRGAIGGLREQRRSEAVQAALFMSAELLMGDLPDTRMEDAHEMIGLIEGVIAAVEPTTVYVHSAADNHQDHRAVHAAVVIAARRIPQLLCYQSPSSRNQFAPTKFVPVEDTIEAKVELLSCYRSQADRHYLAPDLVLASARYWARQLTHTRYVEPFEVLRSAE